VRLPRHVDYPGLRRENPLAPDAAFLNTVSARAVRPRDARDRTRLDTSWTRRGTGFRYLSPGVSPPRPSTRPRRSLDARRPVHGWRGARGHAPCSSPFFPKAMARLLVSGPSATLQAPLQPGPGARRRRGAMSKSRATGGTRTAFVARYGADTVRPLPDVHGPVGPGGPVESVRIGGVARPFIGRVWTLALDPHGTRSRVTQPRARCPPAEMPRRPERTIPGRRAPDAGDRSRRDLRKPSVSTRLVARLSWSSPTCCSGTGHTEVRGRDAWQEAIALLELMLAPAGPHVTEELWARHLAAESPCPGLHIWSVLRMPLECQHHSLHTPGPSCTS